MAPHATPPRYALWHIVCCVPRWHAAFARCAVLNWRMVAMCGAELVFAMCGTELAYGGQRSIPICTLKNFPNAIEHTI
eukprot:863270-Rhodomonas_salina.1